MKFIDLHCDTLFKFYENKNYSYFINNGHISNENLIKGNYLAQCFAIYTPKEIKGEDAFNFFKNQYKIYENNILNTYPTPFLSVENAELLNEKLERLDNLTDKKVKVLGLVHNSENCIGYPHSFDRSDSLKSLKGFGKEVVKACNETDLIIDVSHLNIGGFNDVEKLSTKPFIASHSACRTLCEHSRNLFDEQIKIIASSGGVIGVPFYSKFLNGINKTEIIDVLNHLEHLIIIGGEDVAAIGTDFDGMECYLFIKNAGEIEVFKNSIIDYFGYRLAEKICYKNALRILL